MRLLNFLKEHLRRPSPEIIACEPAAIDGRFNADAALPYGFRVRDVSRSMFAFQDFLKTINTELNSKGMSRIECILPPASFSSMVGEFAVKNISENSVALVKNSYHNGHPDLLPINMYSGNSILRGEEGIEIKASRNDRNWQGHNPESSWVLVFVFDSNKPLDEVKGAPSKPFRFRTVAGARLEESDWNYSGRSNSSRRTITATINSSGREKIMRNWIYKNE